MFDYQSLLLPEDAEYEGSLRYGRHWAGNPAGRFLSDVV